MRRIQLPVTGVAVLTVILFLSPSHVLGSKILYNTFGPGDSYSSGGWNVSGPSHWNGEIDMAMPFTPATSSFLLEIDLALEHSTSTGTNRQVDVMLATDNGGLPGSVQETVILDSVTTNGIYTATFSGTTWLDVTEQYWIWLSSPEDNITTWHFNGQNLPGGNYPYSMDNGLNWVLTFVGPPAFRVQGEVPEPSSLVLAAIGLLSLAFYRWTKK